MSTTEQRYKKVTEELTAWFAEKLATVTEVIVSEEDYLKGTDALTMNLKRITKEASRVWLKEKNYELSYNQICVAFFAAAQQLGKLNVTARHPIFRLHTQVVVKEVTAGPLDVDKSTKHNVPGVITNVEGERYTVELGRNPKGGTNAVFVNFADLENELTLTQ